MKMDHGLRAHFVSARKPWQMTADSPPDYLSVFFAVGLAGGFTVPYLPDFAGALPAGATVASSKCDTPPAGREKEKRGRPLGWPRPVARPDTPHPRRDF
jgi:cation diffusion facilitator CzcD-associated flavoprotein CzcO